MKNIIKIIWKGPFAVEEVIKNNTNEDDDSGIYQIYGRHILYKKEKENKVLLYVGQTQKRTFSERLKEHVKDLLSEDNPEELKVFLGRLVDASRYTEKDDWARYYMDVDMAESVIIHKYCPSYNSQHILEEPDRKIFSEVVLIHEGAIGDLHSKDIAPNDFKR